MNQLEATLNTMVAALVPKSLAQRGRQVAIDLIELPYHGAVDDAHQHEVRRGRAKQGTAPFFAYATAYAVVHGKRYALALCRVTATMSMDEVVQKLLSRLDDSGVKVRVLLPDRGFYSLCSRGSKRRDRYSLSVDGASRDPQNPEDTPPSPSH